MYFCIQGYYNSIAQHRGHKKPIKNCFDVLNEKLFIKYAIHIYINKTYFWSVNILII